MIGCSPLDCPRKVRAFIMQLSIPCKVTSASVHKSKWFRAPNLRRLGVLLTLHYVHEILPDRFYRVPAIGRWSAVVMRMMMYLTIVAENHRRLEGWHRAVGISIPHSIIYRLRHWLSISHLWHWLSIPLLIVLFMTFIDNSIISNS